MKDYIIARQQFTVIPPYTPYYLCYPHPREEGWTPLKQQAARFTAGEAQKVFKAHQQQGWKDMRMEYAPSK